MLAVTLHQLQASIHSASSDADATLEQHDVLVRRLSVLFLNGNIDPEMGTGKYEDLYNKRLVLIKLRVSHTYLFLDKHTL